ncbi:hypothetical protein HDU76_011089, partial [Blyttiomyces sp. JEL0837]
YYDASCRSNAELARLRNLNHRYQAIICQLLPMLAAHVQDGVRMDMNAINQLAMAPLTPLPPLPPLHQPQQQQTHHPRAAPAIELLHTRPGATTTLVSVSPIPRTLLLPPQNMHHQHPQIVLPPTKRIKIEHD